MGDLGAALVVFSVVGYFILRHCCYKTSFRWDALEWQQNIFESTGLGLFLFAFGRLAGPLLYQLPGWLKTPAERVVGMVKERIPFPFPGTLLAAIVIGILLAAVVNRVWPRDKALGSAVRHHGGSLRILLHTAHRSNRPVMLSLNNRKVYVGWVFTPPPLRRPSHVVVFPTLSGYRSNDTLAIAWTTNYSPVYEDIIERKQKGEAPPTDLEHFQLVIPVELVASATFFDIDIYHRHFAPERSEGTASLPPS